MISCVTIPNLENSREKLMIDCDAQDRLIIGS